MKKCNHLIAISLLSISTYSIASQPRYYIAADAGIFQADFNNFYVDQLDVIPLNITQSAIQHAYTIGARAGFRTPYTEQIFWGGELAAHLEGHNASIQSGASSTVFSDNLQVESNLDLAFVPGLMLTNTIGSYLKLGVSLAYLQDTVSSPAGFLAVTQRYNARKLAPGFLAGLGITQSLTQHTSIYAETNYYDYGTISFPGFQNFSTSYAHSAHLYTYNVVVGAAYNF